MGPSFSSPLSAPCSVFRRGKHVYVGRSPVTTACPSRNTSRKSHQHPTRSLSGPTFSPVSSWRCSDASDEGTRQHPTRSVLAGKIRRSLQCDCTLLDGLHNGVLLLSTILPGHPYNNELCVCGASWLCGYLHWLLPCFWSESLHGTTGG